MNDVQAQLNALRLSYYQSLPDRFSRIEYLWQELQQDSSHAANYEEFYRLIHGIAGSAETFGLPALTATARRLLNQIKQLPRPWQQIPSIQGDLAEIAQIINSVTKS